MQFVTQEKHSCVHLPPQTDPIRLSSDSAVCLSIVTRVQLDCQVHVITGNSTMCHAMTDAGHHHVTGRCKRPCLPSSELKTALADHLNIWLLAS